MIGYTLYPHEYPFHKAILLIGEGFNGKSTFCRLLRTILGDHNVSSVNLRDLDPRVNKFAAANLVDKLANIASEPAKSGAFDPTLFKQLTGEGLVLVERKYKDPYETTIYAKMIFSANELPQVTEDTYAFWRRLIAIKFSNQFMPGPTFFERTFTGDEIEGIIICALYAFRLMLLRKRFTEQSIADPRKEWLSRSNPVYKVMKSMIDDGVIKLDPNGWIVKKGLYNLYIAYAKKLKEEGKGVSTVAQNVFTQKIEQLLGIRSGQKKIRGKNVKVYLGVKIKNYELAAELVGEPQTPPESTPLTQHSESMKS